MAYGGGPPSGRKAPGFPILVGVGVVLVLLLMAIAGAALSIMSLSRDQAELQDHNVPYAVAIFTAALNAKGIANDERGYLISGDPEFLTEIDQRLLNVRTAFAEATITAQDDVQRRAAANAHAGFERWMSALDRHVKTFKAGDPKGATDAALGPGRALRKEYEASLAEAQDVATSAIELRRNSFASSGWVFILLACLLAVLALGVGVTFWVLRALEKFGAGEEPPETVGAPIAVFPTPAKRSGRDSG